LIFSGVLFAPPGRFECADIVHTGRRLVVLVDVAVEGFGKIRLRSGRFEWPAIVQPPALPQDPSLLISPASGVRDQESEITLEAVFHHFFAQRFAVYSEVFCRTGLVAVEEIQRFKNLILLSLYERAAGCPRCRCYGI
jgi:hypothetical protein